MVVYKDIALGLGVINKALTKEYADEKEIGNVIPHLIETGVYVIKGLHEVTYLMHERGNPIERCKIISLELEIGRFLDRIIKTGLLANEAKDNEDGFISMLRGLNTMCKRYVEMLLEFDGKVMLADGTIIDYNKKQPEKQVQVTEWPQELNNEQFKVIVRKGIESGLIEEKAAGLKWNGTKELLAYFAERVSKHFHLSKKVDVKGNETISWRPFECLFNVSKLKEAKQNNMRLNTRFEPNGFEKVDRWFEE